MFQDRTTIELRNELQQIVKHLKERPQDKNMKFIEVLAINSELQGRSQAFTTWITIGIAIMSLFVSISAICTSINTARSDQYWEDQQLMYLEKLSNIGESVINYLEK